MIHELKLPKESDKKKMTAGSDNIAEKIEEVNS